MTPLDGEPGTRPAADLRFAGAPLAEARAAVVLLHGRGASAEGILQLAPYLDPGGVAFVAPQAPAGSWYPASFLAPFADNEPQLSAALATARDTLRWIEANGIAADRRAIGGFSQGACLALETAAREPSQVGAVLAFTGGRIGPRGTSFRTAGSLAGAPVLISAGDPDPHVPWWRVAETAELFLAMGAEVDLRRFPRRPHTILEEELEAAAAILRRLAGRPAVTGDESAG